MRKLRRFSAANVQDEAPDGPMTTQQPCVAGGPENIDGGSLAQPEKRYAGGVWGRNLLELLVDLPEPIPTIRPLCSTEFALFDTREKRRGCSSADGGGRPGPGAWSGRWQPPTHEVLKGSESGIGR